jgi:hypothetical protein
VGSGRYGTVELVRDRETKEPIVPVGATGNPKTIIERPLLPSSDRVQ